LGRPIVHTTTVACAFELLAGIDARGWERIADATARHVSGRLSREGWQAACERVLYAACDRFATDGRFGAYDLQATTIRHQKLES